RHLAVAGGVAQNLQAVGAERIVKLLPHDLNRIGDPGGKNLAEVGIELLAHVADELRAGAPFERVTDERQLEPEEADTEVVLDLAEVAVDAGEEVGPAGGEERVAVEERAVFEGFQSGPQVALLPVGNATPGSRGHGQHSMGPGGRAAFAAVLRERR